MTRAEDADLQGAAGVSFRALEAEADEAADLEAAQADDDDDEDAAEAIAGEGAGPRPVRLGGVTAEWPSGRGRDDGRAGWDFEIPRTVAPYLKADETRVIPMRLHHIRLLMPALVTVGGLLAAIALNAWAYASGHDAPIVVHVTWGLWAVGVAWSAYMWAEWRQTWFVVTGHRVIFIKSTRLLGRHVTMLPISKMRDLAYQQTGLGRLLGYATFDFASIGTEKALDLIRFIPWPEWTYQQITELIMPDTDRRAVKQGRTGRG